MGGVEPRAPVWGGPARHVLGQAVPISTVLVKTDEVAIALVGVTAFPTGMMFTLRAARRRPARTRRDRVLFQQAADPFGYGASRTTIDAAPIRDAAAHAVTLWADDEGA